MTKFDDPFEIEDEQPTTDLAEVVENDDPFEVGGDVEEEPVVAKIPELVEGDEMVSLPKLKEDCVHHFVIPTVGVLSIGMCKKCGGGKVFNSFNEKEFN